MEPELEMVGYPFGDCVRASTVGVVLGRGVAVHGGGRKVLRFFFTIGGRWL